MDEYSKEIGDLEAQVEAMLEAEEDPKEIAEMAMQTEVLKAIYARVGDLLEAGRRQPGLRAALALRGYGDWTLDNVYAFVYETSVELPTEGHHEFVQEIRTLDFQALLAS